MADIDRRTPCPVCGKLTAAVGNHGARATHVFDWRGAVQMDAMAHMPAGRWHLRVVDATVAAVQGTATVLALVDPADRTSYVVAGHAADGTLAWGPHRVVSIGAVGRSMGDAAKFLDAQGLA